MNITFENVVSTALLIYVISFVFRLKNFRLFYIGVLFHTAFFGLLSAEILRVENLFNHMNIAIIFYIIAYLRHEKSSYVFNKEHKKLLYSIFIFVVICVVSYIKTVSSGFSYIESFKLAIYFFSYLFFFVFLKFFDTSEKDELDNFIKTIVRLTLLNAVLYILNALGIYTIAAENYQILGEVGIRNFSGFPIFLLFAFLLSYVDFRREFSIRTLIPILICVTCILFTYTRSLILAYFTVIILIEIIFLKVSFFSVLRNTVMFLLILVAFAYIFPVYFSLITDRFSELNEVDTFLDLNNVSYRIEVLIERFEIILKNNRWLGVGFINQKESIGFETIFGTFLIHGDIFYANLLIIGGFLGLIFFGFIFYYLFKISLLEISSKYHLMLFCYCIYILLLSFSSGQTLMAASLDFFLIVSYFVFKIEVAYEK